MVKLLTWLFAQSGVTLDVEEDTAPLTAANKILSTLGQAGFDARDAVEIAPTSLTTGYGENVCRILNWLCDQALSTEKHRLKRPVYPLPATEYEEELDQEEEEEEEMLDEIEESGDQLVHPIAHPEPDTLNESVEPIRATVDIEQWKLECERVEPRLKQIRRILNGDNLSNRAILPAWYLHLETLRKHANQLNEFTRSSENNAISTATQLNQLHQVSIFCTATWTWLTATLIETTTRSRASGETGRANESTLR